VRIAITGGTGFVGGHLAKALSAGGHDVVVLARGVDRRPWAHEVLRLPRVTFLAVDTTDESRLAQALVGSDAVAHCAGINREIGRQTYESVHIQGTEAIVKAVQAAAVPRLAYLSFLRARPACGSPYHESKWAAEELIRGSTSEWTVLKPGMMFGRGDHMLDHLSHALYTFPFFLGIGQRRVRPLAVEDTVAVLVAALVEGRLPGKTVGLVGPTEIGFDDAARLVARVLRRAPVFVPMPMAFHRSLARVAERVMKVPLISLAQVRILEEEVIEPTNAPDGLPDDLIPGSPFNEASIRAGLPDAGPFGFHDLRSCAERERGSMRPARWNARVSAT
jgi:uncharacterized protein YbjT (DUF2867 family)